MTFDFSLALNRWDVILVIVVSLQTAILAYAASPKAKSVMMTLPFPFTIVTLSLGLDVDATTTGLEQLPEALDAHLSLRRRGLRLRERCSSNRF